MQNRFDRCSEAHRDEALSELRADGELEWSRAVADSASADVL